MAPDCPICAKHRGTGSLVGPRVWEDEQVVVSHRPADADGTAVLGYLFVETRRHVAALDELTRAEATAVALAIWRAARALRAEMQPEFVFSAIIGRGVAHFHQHLFPRPPGVPDEFDWLQTSSWPGIPRGTEADAVDLCSRLARHEQ